MKQFMFKMVRYQSTISWLAIIIAVAAILMTLLSVSSHAYPVDEEGNPIIPQTVMDTCMAKGDVTMFTYRHRDHVTEQRMLEILDFNWSETWNKNPNIRHITYVDMQRIIRDAYRTDRNGKYKRDCCTDAVEEERTNHELYVCYNQTKY